MSRQTETTISVSNKIWKHLNKKKNVGETFNEVIERTLKEAEGSD